MWRFIMVPTICVVDTIGTNLQGEKKEEIKLLKVKMKENFSFNKMLSKSFLAKQ